MEFDPYGALMIAAINRFNCVPFNTPAVNILDCLQYLQRMLRALLAVVRVNVLIQKIICVFCAF